MKVASLGKKVRFSRKTLPVSLIVFRMLFSPATVTKQQCPPKERMVGTYVE